ncbi:MAG: hypothetical protein J5J00_10435 [Deltaproteobacteria bacterium]|nr:hypothetical protein [Deltaproteobacteria bacterium]
MPAIIPRRTSNALFKRKQLLLHIGKAEGAAAVDRYAGDAEPNSLSTLRETSVLIANASQHMAKEMTIQLGLSLPGCSLIYAPTVEMARLILKRRSVDLIVSSPILPDGSIEGLRAQLEKLDPPPDLIVIGEKSSLDRRLLQRSVYSFSGIERLSGKKDSAAPRKATEPASGRSVSKGELQGKVKSIGADLRNDLNNPLQEIVAMVFVAKAGGIKSETTELALNAIDKAAQNMAQVVGSLERKILSEIAVQTEKDYSQGLTGTADND